MKCKSSKPILIKLLWAGITVVLLAPRLDGQQPSPSASPKPSFSYVRIWNMLPAKAAPTLQLLTAADKVLTTATAANYGASYTSIAPGPYTFTIRKTNDATGNALKNQPLLMRGDVYVTFLASEKNGQAAVEMIDDTQDPKRLNDPAQLVIRQFIPGARVTVTTREGAASQEVAYGDSTILANLPHQLTLLTMKAAGLGPEVKTWNAEADFSGYRHATLLIVADPYGRFRPRLSYDGQTVAVLTAALNATSAASPKQ